MRTTPALLLCLMFLAAPASTAHAATATHRLCMVVAVTDSSACVVWNGDALATGAVAYGTTPACPDTVAALRSDTAFTACLRNLPASTRFYYNIIENGRPLFTPDSMLFFSTVPSSPRASMVFACIGDTRRGTESFDTDHHAVIASILRHTPLLFLLHSGDLFNAADPGARETFFRIQSPILRRSPVLPVAGNGDIDGVELARLFRTGDTPWYAVSRGSVFVIGLDILFKQPASYYERHIGPRSAQYQWLDSTLQSSQRKRHPFTIVFFHAPLFTPDNTGCAPAADVLRPLFERHKVDAVISGGLHYFSHAYVNGISYVVSGGGGATLERPRHSRSKQVTFHESIFHHLRMSVRYPVLAIEAVDNRGTVFFSHEIFSREVRASTRPEDDRLTEQDSTEPSLILYGSPSCEECIAFKTDILPRIAERVSPCSLVVRFVDTDDAENFRRYLEIERRSGPRTHVFPVVRIGETLYSGEDLSFQRLAEAIDEACKGRISVGGSRRDAAPLAIGIVALAAAIMLITIKVARQRKERQR